MPTNLLVQEINRDLLTGLVQKALDRPTIQITSWNVQTVYGGFELESALLRFQGEARQDGETIPWSLILKAINPSEKINNPAGFRYWKREALAYQSGLLHQLPGGNITAPACYGVYEQPDGSIWIWLEDVKDDICSPWPIDQYAIVARHLGQFNGAYLTGESIPAEPWITHNWLRMYVENAVKMVEFIRKDPHHPAIRKIYSNDTLAKVLAIWDERDPILKMLENLPQVFCHQDAFKRNLFTRGGRTIAIDWGYLGNAPVGAELAALIAGSMFVCEIPAERVMEMDQRCTDGYLEGLCEAGWNGDPQIARTGYAVTLLLRYIVGGPIGEVLPILLDQELTSKLELAFDDKSATEAVEDNPAINAYFPRINSEALKLLGVK